MNTTILSVLEDELAKERWIIALKTAEWRQSSDRTKALRHELDVERHKADLIDAECHRIAGL